MEKHEEPNEEQKRIRLQRRDLLCVIGYLVIVFGYSLAILLVAIPAYDQTPTVTQGYLDIIDNWNMDAINEFKVGTCSGTYETSLSQRFNQAQLQDWVMPEGSKVRLCQNRVPGYSFASTFITTPKCRSPSDQICGGIDLETKFCVPNNTACPINSLMMSIKNEAQYTKIATLPGSQTLYASTLTDNIPIVELRLAYGPGVCNNRDAFVSQQNSQFYNDVECGGLNMDYTLIQTVSAKSFMEANGVSLLSEYDSSTVGLFSRSYVRFAMACRETLVDRILESKGYWDLMTSSMPVLLVISAVYFGLVGVLLNVLQIIYSSLCPVVLDDHDGRVFIRRGIILIRVLCFLTLSISIIITYFLAAQMHNTINRSIQENCSTEDVIATLNELLDRLSRWRAYVVPIFWIYIAALIVEALATYIAIYRSISNKRRFLRNLYKEHEEQELQAPDYERLQTEPSKPAAPVFQQRPSFNPNDQMQLRMSIKRMSMRGGKPGKPTTNINVAAHTIKAESDEDSPVARDMSFQPMKTQAIPVNTFTTPTNARVKNFDTFQQEQQEPQSGGPRYQSPNFQQHHRKQMSSNYKQGSESEFRV